MGERVLISLTNVKDCVRDINIINPDGKSQAAVTFGVGCSSQDMTDALDKSGLFIISAAASMSHRMQSTM